MDKPNQKLGGPTIFFSRRHHHNNLYNHTVTVMHSGAEQAPLYHIFPGDIITTITCTTTQSSCILVLNKRPYHIFPGDIITTTCTTTQSSCILVLNKRPYHIFPGDIIITTCTATQSCILVLNKRPLLTDRSTARYIGSKSVQSSGMIVMTYFLKIIELVVH